MKYTLNLIALLYLVTGAMAQQDSMKDQKIIENKRIKIVISEDDEDVRLVDSMSRKIKITRSLNKSDDDNFKFVETKMCILELGLNNYMSPNGLEPQNGYADMEADKAKSINFNLGIIQQGLNLVKGKLRLVYGVGIEYNNYRFKTNIDLITGTKPLEIKENIEVEYKKNKLVTQYLSMPLTLNFKSNPKDKDESFNLSAGVVGGYLIGSHQKQKWEANGTEKRKVRDDFNLNDFRYGYMLSFGYGHFNLFAKYYPTPVFKNNQGPELNTVAAGIVVNVF